jgi:hypothetical protein
MTVLDPDQGITLQVGTDPANLPSAQNAEFAGLLQRMNRLYANEAARTALMLVLAENNISSLAAEDRTEIFNGLNHISLRTRANFQTVRRATDAAAINNSTALVSDAVMTTVLPAVTGVFRFRDTIVYSSSQAADYKIAYTFPGTAWWGGVGLATGATGTTGDGQFAVTTASGTSAAYGGAAVGTRLLLMVTGEVTLAGVGGNLVLQYAQQTLDATNTVPAYAGTAREIWRVS